MRHLIFLGGEAGVGKTILSKELMSKIGSSLVIDKDEFTSVLVNKLLELYGQPTSDRESQVYVENVKPLEYEQIDNMIWDGIKNTSLIITAPFFDSFLDIEWLEKMELLGDFHNTKVDFIFLTRCPNKVRTGLIDRCADRDKWKISNYSDYRKKTDSIIKKILRNNKVKHINFVDRIDVALVTNYLQIMDLAKKE